MIVLGSPLQYSAVRRMALEVRSYRKVPVEKVTFDFYAFEFFMRAAFPAHAVGRSSILRSDQQMRIVLVRS
jgi:hypothetical protein